MNIIGTFGLQVTCPPDEHEEKSLQHSNLYFKLNVRQAVWLEVNKGENERENGFFSLMHNYPQKVFV